MEFIYQQTLGDYFVDWFHVIMPHGGRGESWGISSEGNIMDPDGFPYDPSTREDLGLPEEFEAELKERGLS